MKKIMLALIIMLSTSAVFAADLKISWAANTETDLAGYTLNYAAPGDTGWNLNLGKWSYTGALTHQIELGLVTAYTITGAVPGPYAVVLRAKDSAGNISDYSAVVEKLVPTQPIAPVVIPIDAQPGKPMTITITVQ
jgi:hypothetical protein